MKKKFQVFFCLLHRLRLIIWCCLLAASLNSCTKFFYNNLPISVSPYHVIPVDSPQWVSWNVLFQPGSDAATRSQQIAIIKDYIRNYLAVYNFTPSFREQFCPCDSTLYNINAIPVLGSGQSLIPPPPPPPPPHGSGDNFVATLNHTFVLDSVSKVDTENIAKIHLNNVSVNTSRLLAIMDTGLDTTFFDSKIRELLWTSSTGMTLRNFTFDNPFHNLDYFRDDNPGKHGTAVTTIALQAMGATTTYPGLMVLKVLNNNESGTTFNVGCAMSYAIQNHATIINASLGYYTDNPEPDPVLNRYLARCNEQQDSIFVFAAAGNLPSPHMLPLCTSPTPSSNELLGSPTNRLFYPACFSDALPNVITVTGLRDLSGSCIYQNYSSRYVSLGVKNDQQSCCIFTLSSIHMGFEGSSFATPVVSGKVMWAMLNHPGVTALTVRQALNTVTQKASTLINVTKDGTFLQIGRN